MVYGFERGIWRLHARQPRSSSSKWREFALLVFKIKLSFFYSKYFFGIIKHFYYIVVSKILKIHSEIFSISSLVKISIT